MFKALTILGGVLLMLLAVAMWLWGAGYHAGWLDGRARANGAEDDF